MKITLEKIKKSQRTVGDIVGVVDEIIVKLMPATLRNGLFLEFGVWKGTSIRKISKIMKQNNITCPIYGFDSFQGLPEIWGKLPPESFKLNEDEIPVFNEDNIVINKGLFQDVLPDFILNNPGFASFIHIDCDLYSSTKFVLDTMKNNIKPGTIILFDEMINVDDWENQEFKAFNEYLNESGHDAHALCHGKFQVAFRII